MLLTPTDFLVLMRIGKSTKRNSEGWMIKNRLSYFLEYLPPSVNKDDPPPLKG